MGFCRKVDASNIKEVLKSRNTRSTAVASPGKTSLHQYRSNSFFKKEKPKHGRRSFISRANSQSEEAIAAKRQKHKRVVSYSELTAEIFNVPEENSTAKYKSSYFFPWYIKQVYKPQEQSSAEQSEKSKVMTLWPAHMKSSLYKLQIICVFHNFHNVRIKHFTPTKKRKC